MADTEEYGANQNVDPSTYLPSTVYSPHGPAWSEFMSGEESGPSSGLGENTKSDPRFGKIPDYTGPYGGSDS